MSNEYIRRIDDLGRLVIPGELRNALGINERDAIQISQLNANQIVLSKAYATCFICGEKELLVYIGGVNVCASCRDKLKDAQSGDKIEINRGRE